MAGILNQLMSSPTPATGSMSTVPGSMSKVSPPNGVKANNPNTNVTPPSTTLSSSYQAAPTVSQSSIQAAAKANPSSFDFLPGESPQAYNSRIAALTSGQGSGQTGSAGGGQVGSTNNLTYPTNNNYTGGAVSGGTSVPSSMPTNNGFLNQLMNNSTNSPQASENQNIVQTQKNYQDLQNSIVGGDQPLYFKQGEQGQAQINETNQLAAEGSLLQYDTAQQNANTAAASAGATATLPSNQNVQVPYNNQYLNGATGQAVNPQAGEAMQSAVNLEMQKVQNNQESLAQAQSNLSAYGQAGLNALNQGLGPNFNANTNAGVSAAQASNATVGGTAAVNAGNTAYQSANPAYLKLSNYTIPNIEGFSQLLTSGAGGINPFASQYANQTLQQFQNQLSSTQQAQFQTTFQQLKQSIADLAGSGGSQTPTANSAQADATLSPTATMSTIQSTLDRISQEGQQYLNSQAALNNAALSQAQGGNGANNPISAANPWH